MRVSVSIVTYEAGRWLLPCLESVFAQTHPVHEVVVVDNGSQDGTIAALASVAESQPRLAVTTNRVNVGYARGQNQAIALTDGDAILVLNQDVELDTEFVSRVVSELERDPKIGSVQGRVRHLGSKGDRTDLLDTTGLVVRRDRRFSSRGQSQPDGPESDAAGEVFGPDGPCPVYRRTALEDVREPRSGGGTEVFDEDFFMYHEDTDLAWRLRLRGWSTWYQPGALAWHARGSAGPTSLKATELLSHGRTTRGSARRSSWRNHRLMQLKNEQLELVRRDLFPILRREIGSLTLMALTRPGDLRAMVSLIRQTPGALRKRRWIQGRRISSASEMARWLRDD